MLRWFVVLGLTFLPSLDVLAQRNLKDIPDPDPELERRSFEVAEGFEVNLYAADPRIAKPIQMNFDAQGRLWIAGSEMYPQIKPGQEANDKVLIVEDQDGDGVAEKTTVFADGLLIPTGVLPGDGGAYVANSTQLLHLSDTDGDGKADKKRIVLSGFGTEDTHHILHTLRWGPEGLMYMNQSIYIHSHIETPFGVKRLNAGGIWQFRPETLELDVYMRGLVNSWGHHFDQWGQSFATDGAGGEGINYVVPGAAYFTAVGVPRLIRGLNPGSPKHCGLEVMSGRHLPDHWQGTLLTNDFRGHRVCRFKLTESGSGYVSQEQEELIKTKHVAFRPIDIKMGPDGAIYIADWYNPIIQHGEVDFRDPRRDHTHGRIWRVTYKGKPLVKRPQLVDAATSELLNHLKSNEGWTRHFAKRVLKERGETVLPELDAWVNGLDTTDPLSLRHRLEALWMYQALRSPRVNLLKELLACDDHHVRAAATRVIGHWQSALPDRLGLLERMVQDEHAQVRLEAVRVLGKVPSAASAGVALKALDAPMDRFLDYALWLTCRELKDHWLPRLQQGELLFGGDISQLTFAFRAVDAPAVATPLFRLLSEGKFAADQQADVVEVIASLGNPQELSGLLDLTLKETTSDELKVQFLSHLEQTTQRRNVRPAGDLAAKLKPLLTAEQRSLRVIALRCVGLWKVGSLRDVLNETASDSETEELFRHAAVTGLASLGGPASSQTLAKLSSKEYPLSLRIRAVTAWAGINPAGASKAASGLLSELKTEADAEPIFSAYLARRQGSGALAKEVQSVKLQADIAKVGIRLIETSSQPHKLLTSALEQAGNIKTGPVKLTADQLAKMVEAVASSGDPARGEAIYRRESLQCQKCHSIGGAGGVVGPDIISLGASAPVDYIIESLLDPNKKVKENYQTLVVADDDGKVTTGIKLRETDQDLVVRTPEGKEVRIPLKNIDEVSNGASIMPAGLAGKLTQQELLDLVSFLSKLGKVGGDYSLSKAPIMRRWRVLESTEQARYHLRRTSDSRAATDNPAFTWKPVYSTVGGLLPVTTIPEVSRRNRVAPGTPGAGFLRCEIQVHQAGEFELRLNSADGLELWVGQKPQTVSERITLKLPAGNHRLTWLVDLSKRKSPLRLELGEVKGSSAQVEVIGGP